MPSFFVIKQIGSKMNKDPIKVTNGSPRLRIKLCELEPILWKDCEKVIYGPNLNVYLSMLPTGMISKFAIAMKILLKFNAFAG